MNRNKNIFFIIVGFVLLGTNVYLLNYNDLGSEKNISFYLGILLSFVIIYGQYRKLKSINQTE